MSLYDYQKSRELNRNNVPFDAMIMAALRKADGHNLDLLKGAFPELWLELHARYNTPNGRLESDTTSSSGD